MKYAASGHCNKTHVRRAPLAGTDAPWIEGGRDRFHDARDAALVDHDVAIHAIEIFEPQLPREWKSPDLHEGQREIGLPEHRMNGVGDLGASHERYDAHEG